MHGISTRGGIADFIQMVDGMCVFNAKHGIGDDDLGFVYGSLKDFAARLGRSLYSLRKYVRELGSKGIMWRGWGKDRHGYWKKGFWLARTDSACKNNESATEVQPNCNQTATFSSLYKSEDKSESQSELEAVQSESPPSPTTQHISKTEQLPTAELAGMAEMAEMPTEVLSQEPLFGESDYQPKMPKAKKRSRSDHTPEQRAKLRVIAERVALYERRRYREHPRANNRGMREVTLPVSVESIVRLLSGDHTEEELKAVVEFRFRRAVDNDRSWKYWRGSDLWRPTQLLPILNWLQEPENKWAWELARNEGAEVPKTPQKSQEDLQADYEAEMKQQGRSLFITQEGVHEWWLPAQIAEYKKDKQMKTERATDAKIVENHVQPAPRVSDELFNELFAKMGGGE
jgi:hypothetical protein